MADEGEVLNCSRHERGGEHKEGSSEEEAGGKESTGEVVGSSPPFGDSWLRNPMVSLSSYLIRRESEDEEEEDVDDEDEEEDVNDEDEEEGEEFYPGRHEHRIYNTREIRHYTCSGCQQFGANGGFKCSQCPNFVLHEPCAIWPDVYDHPSFPQDPFEFVSETPLRHECNACGKELRGFMFQSRDEHVRLHPLCTALPMLFEYSRHRGHNLPLVAENQGRYICRECNIGNINWKYRCEANDCGFELDVNCAIVDFHSMSDLPLLQIPRRHEHDVYFTRGISHYTCSGCQQFGVGGGYKCRQCPNFVLHRPCAEWPDVHIHPFFPQDPFEFVPETPLHHQCNACGKELRGSMFQSRDEHLRLHPLCIALPEEFRYMRHHDNLQLVQNQERYSCSECNIRDTNWKYRCDACRYELDMNCAIVGFHHMSESGVTLLQNPSEAGR